MSEISKGILEGKTAGVAIGSVYDTAVLETLLTKKTSIIIIKQSNGENLNIEVKTKLLKNYLKVLLDALEGV